MSYYRFNDVITLYTPIGEEDYERHVINATKIQLIDSDQMENTRATVYIPIYGRRSLKYKLPSQRAERDKNSFTVTANQKVYLGYCPESYPPDSALTVRKAETHLSGSRHVQHVKIIAYNIPPKEEEDEESYY